MRSCFDTVIDVIHRAIDEQIFPCANIEIGNSKGTLFRYSAGYRRIRPDKLKADEETIFDMASVTKVMTATTVTLILVEKGILALSDKMGQFYDDIPDSSRDITVKHLLTHTSGIPGYLSIVGKNRDKIDMEILSLPPSYPKGTRVDYACLGFILLGRLLERITGKSLDKLAKDLIFEPLSMKNTGFSPKGENIASTAWDDTPIGVVNDYNARYLGFPVGNAGLFSNLSDCATFCRMLLNGGQLDGNRILSKQTILKAATNHTPSMDEARGLGFHMVSQGAGPVVELFSEAAFGHTGWTGTSIVIDPCLDLYVVLLTNRTHFNNHDADKMARARRLIHNAVISSTDKLSRES
ncbi:MAG: beta-lactamase family protein [Clostridiales bacterium]|jgi:CubicO group peptidase (beta-lactamase class C family)|nr:beta-lactamase family protein [Clostridiales bacterium]